MGANVTFWLVVNCSQIFCTFAAETTFALCACLCAWLWIALKFFVLLQPKQPACDFPCKTICCELLSNFLYFCSRNNRTTDHLGKWWVVNCSQIFCTFAAETTCHVCNRIFSRLWIALKFFVLLQPKQLTGSKIRDIGCCELLSNFLYFCSRNNYVANRELSHFVVNCSQIFCTFAAETTAAVNIIPHVVVNCSQIFCTFAAETTHRMDLNPLQWLWIALKFFVLLQPKQLRKSERVAVLRCELLSNFLYFCSRNNLWLTLKYHIDVVNCSQIFCTFAAETTLLCCEVVLLGLWIALKFFVLLQPKQLVAFQRR